MNLNITTHNIIVGSNTNINILIIGNTHIKPIILSA